MKTSQHLWIYWNRWKIEHNVNNKPVYRQLSNNATSQYNYCFVEKTQINMLIRLFNKRKPVLNITTLWISFSCHIRQAVADFLLTTITGKMPSSSVCCEMMIKQVYLESDIPFFFFFSKGERKRNEDAIYELARIYVTIFWRKTFVYQNQFSTNTNR